MDAKLIIDLVKIVGIVIASGVAGYQTTGTLEGTLAAIGSGLTGLFIPNPKKGK